MSGERSAPMNSAISPLVVRRQFAVSCDHRVKPLVVLLAHEVGSAHVVGRHSLQEHAVCPPPLGRPLRVGTQPQPLPGIGQPRIECFFGGTREPELLEPLRRLGGTTRGVDDEIGSDVFRVTVLHGDTCPGALETGVAWSSEQSDDRRRLTDLDVRSREEELSHGALEQHSTHVGVAHHETSGWLCPATWCHDRGIEAEADARCAMLLEPR